MVQVPSGFLLTDALLLLDKKYEGKLIIPTETQTKEDLAGREAKRIKKLLGALRHLFRNSACSKKKFVVAITSLFGEIFLPSNV